MRANPTSSDAFHPESVKSVGAGCSFRTMLLTSFPEVWPNVRAAISAGSTHKLTFKIGERNMIRPLISIDAYPVQTTRVRAVDDQAMNVGCSHLAERHLSAVHRYPPFGHEMDDDEYTETSAPMNPLI